MKVAKYYVVGTYRWQENRIWIAAARTRAEACRKARYVLDRHPYGEAIIVGSIAALKAAMREPLPYIEKIKYF